jgi:hypothetical protein
LLILGAMLTPAPVLVMGLVLTAMVAVKVGLRVRDDRRGHAGPAESPAVFD